MLTFISKTFRHFWGNQIDVPSDKINTNSISANKLQNEVPVISRTLVGKITDICNGYGLIDGHIYFKFETVIGGSHLNVGQFVQVTVTGNEEGGWKADRVMLQTENWELDTGCSNEKTKYDKVKNDNTKRINIRSEENESVQEKMIGFISEIQGRSIVLNKETVLNLGDVTTDIEFTNGDWVSVIANKEVEDGNIVFKIMNIKPLRTRKLQGNISLLRSNFGVVEGEIYFHKSITRNGYIPRMRDLVAVTAIESDQGRLNWRALSILPTSKTMKQRNQILSLSLVPLQNRHVENLLKDKGGITISQTDFGVIEHNEAKILEVQIRNRGDHDHLLEAVKIEDSRNNQFLCSLPHLDPSCKLEPQLLVEAHSSILLWIHCTARFLGKATKIITFFFNGFQIGRLVIVDVRSAEEMVMVQQFCDSAQGTKMNQTYLDIDNNGSVLMPGCRPSNFHHRRLPVPLPVFKVPNEVRKCIANNEEIFEHIPSLSEPLTIQNYSERFHGLLYLEELEKEKQLQRFNLIEVILNRKGDFLALQLSGNEDNYPSVLVGDRVIATYSSGSIDAPHYEGFLHEIFDDEILLKFHPSFHSDYMGEPVNMTFRLNRTPLRRTHQAVELAERLCRDILFPSFINIKSPLISFFERLIECEHCKIDKDSSKTVPTNMIKTCLESSNTLSQDDGKTLETSLYANNEPKNCAEISSHPERRRRKSVVERLFLPNVSVDLQKKSSRLQENSYLLNGFNHPIDQQQCKMDGSLSINFDQTFQQDGVLEQNARWNTINNVISSPNKQKNGPINAFNFNSTREWIKEPVFLSNVNYLSTRERKSTWKANLKGSKLTFCRCACHKSDKSKHLENQHQDLEWKYDLNERQRTAIRYILSGTIRPLPYIIYGPPGTGKTLTIVECILQILRLSSESRILVCCPSNSAADVITERLHQSGEIEKTTMVRLNAYHRVQSSIPDTVLIYSQTIENISLMARYRLIICTCVTAGNFLSIGLHQGHFSHIFIDEAGQVTEPEALLPILFAGPDSQIILAGDPQQLGPVLHSPFAITYGLQISFLERLMHRQLYQRNKERFANHGCYDPLMVTKLVNNYRSHPLLLDLPSELFYDLELIACANENVTNRFCHWEQLPQEGFPLLFHGIWGEELQENNSPSWFNSAEVMQVIHYSRLLFELGVLPEDIGIITPYRKQVEKLRMMMTSLGFDLPKIGSVEEFQGQEKPVIIISTVRSSDSKGSRQLGFLRNYRRFNVSITRSHSLLIIIGNPSVLAQDVHWKSLLKYCITNGGYTGCELDPTFLSMFS